MVPTGGAIRSVSGDDFVQAIESNTRITSGDTLVEWQDEFVTDPASGLTSVWEAQVVTVETANAGAYGNGNAAEVTAPAGDSRKRMTVIDSFGSFANTRVYYDLAIDVLPGANEDIFMVGQRITGAAGSENGYIAVFTQAISNNMKLYRLNNGSETLLETASVSPAITADTAYVVAMECINEQGNRVCIRTAIWDAKLESEGPNWDTLFLDNNPMSIKTVGQTGFAAPDTVAVQLRSAVKGPVCIDMWGVTSLDFQSVDGAVITAQTLRADVSGAYGWLEVPSPVFTGLSAGPLVVRATDPASNYFRDFTLSVQPPVVDTGGGGVIDGTFDDDVTVQVTNSGQGGGGQGGGGQGGGVVNLPPQAGGPFAVTMSIDGYDFASEKWYLILEATEITAGNQSRRLIVAPGISDVTNLAANDGLPYMWRLNMVHGNAAEVVYSAEFKR